MKAILNKINLINSMIEEVKQSENIPFTYAGGTFPHYVCIKPIRVKNQFVTIESDIKNYSFIENKERYNMNKKGYFDNNGVLALNYTLKIILKSFKQSLK